MEIKQNEEQSSTVDALRSVTYCCSRMRERLIWPKRYHVPVRLGVPQGVAGLGDVVAHWWMQPALVCCFTRQFTEGGGGIASVKTEIKSAFSKVRDWLHSYFWLKKFRSFLRFVLFWFQRPRRHNHVWANGCLQSECGDQGVGIHT
jgi:hypothetical protein